MSCLCFRLVDCASLRFYFFQSSCNKKAVFCAPVKWFGHPPHALFYSKAIVADKNYYSHKYAWSPCGISWWSYSTAHSWVRNRMVLIFSYRSSITFVKAIDTICWKMTSYISSGVLHSDHESSKISYAGSVHRNTNSRALLTNLA